MPVVEVQVHAVATTSCGCAVFLGNKEKVFTILVDQSVGAAIAMFMKGTQKHRPLTHDLSSERLALTKCLRTRNDALRNLCSSVRRFRDATLKEECKGDYPQALQSMWKALDRAEDVIQN